MEYCEEEDKGKHHKTANKKKKSETFLAKSTIKHIENTLKFSKNGLRKLDPDIDFSLFKKFMMFLHNFGFNPDCGIYFLFLLPKLTKKGGSNNIPNYQSVVGIHMTLAYAYLDILCSKLNNDESTCWLFDLKSNWEKLKASKFLKIEMDTAWNCPAMMSNVKDLRVDEKYYLCFNIGKIDAGNDNDVTYIMLDHLLTFFYKTCRTNNGLLNKLVDMLDDMSSAFMEKYGDSCVLDNRLIPFKSMNDKTDRTVWGKLILVGYAQERWRNHWGKMYEGCENLSKVVDDPQSNDAKRILETMKSSIRPTKSTLSKTWKFDFTKNK